MSILKIFFPPGMGWEWWRGDGRGGSVKHSPPPLTDCTSDTCTPIRCVTRGLSAWKSKGYNHYREIQIAYDILAKVLIVRPLHSSVPILYRSLDFRNVLRSKDFLTNSIRCSTFVAQGRVTARHFNTWAVKQSPVRTTGIQPDRRKISWCWPVKWFLTIISGARLIWIYSKRTLGGLLGSVVTLWLRSARNWTITE